MKHRTFHQHCIFFGLSVAVLLVTGACFPDASDYFYARYGGLAPFTPLAAAFAAWVMTLILTALGRTFAGLYCGWRLEELSLLGLGLHRTREGRLRLMYRRPFAWAAALLTPPKVDGSTPMTLYLASSAVLPGLVSVTMIIAALYWRADPHMALYLWEGLIMLLSILVSLLPAPGRPGLLRQIRRLADSADLRRSHAHRLHVAAANRRGVSVSELPEELFGPYPAELWTEPDIFSAMANRATRLLNTGRYEEAREILSDLLTTLGDPALHIPRKEVGSHILSCSLSIAEAMTGTASSCSARLDSPEMQRSLNRVGWRDRLLLARYVRALLVLHDASAAEALLRDLEPALAALPTAQAAGSLAILRDAHARAAKTDTQEENP